MNGFLNDLSDVSSFFSSAVIQLNGVLFANTKFRYILFTVIFLTVMPIVIDVILSFILSVRAKRLVLFHSLIFRSRDSRYYASRDSVRYHSLDNRDYQISRKRPFIFNRFGVLKTNHMNIGSPRSFIEQQHKTFSEIPHYSYMPERFYSFSPVQRNPASSHTFTLNHLNSKDNKYVTSRYGALSRFSLRLNDIRLRNKTKKMIAEALMKKYGGKR